MRRFSRWQNYSIVSPNRSPVMWVLEEEKWGKIDSKLTFFEYFFGNFQSKYPENCFKTIIFRQNRWISVRFEVSEGEGVDFTVWKSSEKRLLSEICDFSLKYLIFRLKISGKSPKLLIFTQFPLFFPWKSWF